MTPAGENIPDFSAEKRRVALYSMLAAAAMTVLKLVAGLLSHSLGVLSDAAHSALDLVGATLTFFSVRVSDKPADEDHTYGHGKFENISSFCEVILMAGSSVWIIWEAVKRMIHPGQGLQNLALPVAVVLCSIGVDFWRSRQLHKVAERTGSPALATDAFHFASDIWSSVAVLGGLGAGWVGIVTARFDARVEVVALAAYAWVWGFLYGAIMNLWFWPFARGGALDWHPGLDLAQTLQRYWSFYGATSLGWDAAAAVTNALLVLVTGLVLMRSLRRFAHRLDPAVEFDPLDLLSPVGVGRAGEFR